MGKLIYVDMDDTIADFKGAEEFKHGFDVSYMYSPGFFLNLQPIRGSQIALRQLLAMGYDVQILSQPVAESAHSYSEKVQWIGMHFPELIKKINFTQDKGLFKGDYLIDDNAVKWEMKFALNGGEFIHFNYDNFHVLEWARIVNELRIKDGPVSS